MAEGYEVRGGALPPRGPRWSDRGFWELYGLMWEKSPWWVVLPALAVCYSIYAGTLTPAVTPRGWHVPDPSQIFAVDGSFEPGPHNWRDNYKFTTASGQKLSLICYPDQMQDDCISEKLLVPQALASVQYFPIHDQNRQTPQYVMISAKIGNQIALEHDQRIAFLGRAAAYEDQQHSQFPLFPWALFVLSLAFPVSGILIKLSALSKKTGIRG